MIHDTFKHGIFNLINYLWAKRVTHKTKQNKKKSTLCWAKLSEPYKELSACEAARALYALEVMAAPEQEQEYSLVNARLVSLSALSCRGMYGTQLKVAWRRTGTRSWVTVSRWIIPVWKGLMLGLHQISLHEGEWTSVRIIPGDAFVCIFSLA